MLNSDEIIDEHDFGEIWPEPRESSGGRSSSSNGNDNDDIEGEENTCGGEGVTRNEARARDGKGNANVNGMENGNGK